MERISGVVSRVVYATEGFCVFSLKVDGVGVMIAGKVPRPPERMPILVEGEWKLHPKFGKQFQAAFYELDGQCEDLSVVQGFLESGKLNHVGPAIAKRLLETFGNDVFRVMEFQPRRMAKVKGI
jgi:exodeoxyribonuclease V alpha subunit